MKVYIVFVEGHHYGSMDIVGVYGSLDAARAGRKVDGWDEDGWGYVNKTIEGGRNHGLVIKSCQFLIEEHEVR